MKTPSQRAGSRAQYDLIVRHYSALSELPPADIEIIRNLPPAETWAAGAEIQTEASPSQPRFLLSGWAARFKMLRDGRRQILSIILPGDGIGVCERLTPLALSAIATLTAVRTADAAPLVAALREHSHPLLQQAVHLANAVDEKCLIDQVVRNGRHTAHERICHLFMELHWRLTLSGAVDSQTMPWPLTQEMIADSLGLSIVHVNRMLQQMRREKLIEAGHGMLTILKPEEMLAISEFRPPQPSVATG
ncbi:MAG: Crp/Fnr family transcriptional regulator [Phycisphaerales bacterium]|nr:Crp/Fnr family transcriptional regulator [Hyphomonadaceae bacterium]